MCLIERNQPVYPLDIVRKMRDQRAMMVQTSVSDREEALFSVCMYCIWSAVRKQNTKKLQVNILLYPGCSTTFPFLHST